MSTLKSLGCEMARNDVAVKLDSRVAKEAKMVAAARGVTLAEYISEILRPIVHRDLGQETSKMLGEARGNARKKNAGESESN